MTLATQNIAPKSSESGNCESSATAPNQGAPTTCVPTKSAPMVCAIMQPTFFPWAGYFNLLSKTDVFVFLDDVQFDRRSWQSRNRVFDGGKPSWLTCLTIKAPRETLIKDIKLSTHDDWQSKHIKKLHLNYAKSPFFDEIMPLINNVYDTAYDGLAEINIHIIEVISQLLSIKTRTVRSSSLNADGKRSDKLLNICTALDASDYLSPLGSKQYLLDDGVFDSSGVKLHFQSFDPAPYRQVLSDSFISHLSIIDVIANIGIEQTKRYIEGKYVISERA